MDHSKLPWKVGSRIRAAIMVDVVPGGEFKFRLAECFGEEAEANARFIVKACNERQGLIDALEAWAKFDTESADKHPCPDYALRGLYKEKARSLTVTALALANETGE